jgi:hypothetical protein
MTANKHGDGKRKGVRPRGNAEGVFRKEESQADSVYVLSLSEYEGMGKLNSKSR